MCSTTGHKFGDMGLYCSLGKASQGSWPPFHYSEAPHITRLDSQVVCGHTTSASTRGIATKETGVDGVSTQVGRTRASISSHSRPNHLVSQSTLESGHKGRSHQQITEHRLQSRSQMPPCDQIHLCMICLDRPRELTPTQPSGLSGAGDKKQAERDERKERDRKC